ncbi:MAG: lysylphosphatidylglycerol synthase transmembrane domain-containing protein [Planctomycetota bacterium]
MKRAVRIVIVGLVVLGLIYSVKRSISEWRNQQANGQHAIDEIEARLESVGGKERSRLLAERERIRNEIPSWDRLRVSYLIAASVFYAAGLTAGGLHLRESLLTLGDRVSVSQAIIAQLIGHLGKYVPGKAMVVVLRSRELASAGVKLANAATAVFLETVMMLAVGTAIAGVTLFALPVPKGIAIACCIGGVCVSLLTLPRPLCYVLTLVERFRKEENSPPVAGYRFWAQTWLLQTAAWAGFSLSFGFVISSLPGVPADLDVWLIFAAATASITLGMVAGFVSLLPGGAGVRELILTVVLSPLIGHPTALAAAILARLVFLTVEVFLAGVVRLIRRNFD